MLIDFIRKPGYELKKYSLMGEILFTADCKEEAIDMLASINEKIKVITTNDENVLIYFTDFEKIY